MTARASVSVDLVDVDDVWSVRVLPDRSTDHGVTVPACVQVQTGAGALFLSPAVAAALVEQLRVVLESSEVAA